MIDENKKVDLILNAKQLEITKKLILHRTKQTKLGFQWYKALLVVRKGLVDNDERKQMISEEIENIDHYLTGLENLENKLIDQIGLGLIVMG